MNNVFLHLAWGGYKQHTFKDTVRKIGIEHVFLSKYISENKVALPHRNTTAALNLGSWLWSFLQLRIPPAVI